MNKIDFWSFQREYKFLKKKIYFNLDYVLKKNNIFFGEILNNFEKKFLKLNNSKYGLAVKSGTDALILSMLNSGIGKDDEVITVSFTAIPTVSAIVSVGAKPVFVDINDNFLIDVNKIEKKITKKTKAIIPVHLYGQSCDMEKILKLAEKYHLKIIEDCAQSFLAKYNGIHVGNFGNYGCFSFYPTKILGAYGDGGFIVCKSKSDLERLYKLRFYGLNTKNKKHSLYKKYSSFFHGYNSRIDNIQATILTIKLNYVKSWIIERKKIAENYLKKINCGIKFNPNNVYHLFVLKFKNRKNFINFLKKKKIGFGIHYPNPIHKMNAYSKYVCKNCNCLKKSEKISKEVISIPLHPFLKKPEQNKIIQQINFYKNEKI